MVKKLEVFAHIAVIITALLLCTVLVKKYFFPTKQTPAAIPSQLTAPHRINIGEKLSVAGIDWSQHELTLVLALSTSCRFCTERASFYQALENEKTANVRLIAVLPQERDESRNYLTKLAVHVSDIARAPLGSIGVTGTPTLILVDKNGQVKQSGRGKLPEADSAKVIAELRSGT